jgi:site-specific DNA recombinase
MMTPKLLRAAIYARYSTDKQRQESLDDQYHVCEQVAAREGFKIVGKFGDKEISGGTADRGLVIRPCSTPHACASLTF